MSQKKYISLNRLSNFLDNLKNTFATLSHKHTTADITDYAVDTELSSTSNNPVANSVLNEEFEAISTAMNALELATDGKSQVQIITWEAGD
jgi:N-acetylglucosamine kinase-like BadF-type ATPase